MGIDALKIFIPSTTAFLIGIMLTPFLTYLLYKHKMWKRRGGKTALDGTEATEFNALHGATEVGTPRLGGVIIWGSVVLTALFFGLISMITYVPALHDLSFISRSQTWIPLGVLLLGSLVGAIDDLLEIRGKNGGLRLRTRLFMVALIAALCAVWFYVKLDVSAVSIPFMSNAFPLGILFIPFFILVALFMYAGGVIDGIDGLSGGIFASMFVAYAGVAFFENQLDLAALCAAIGGGTLAFLWFNIPPARFYLSETGTMGLTLTLTVVAFLTDVLGGGRGVSALPIIALPLVATVFSNIIQVLGKKIMHRKILRIAPLHHHFEAIGWPSYKVTMRYWVVGVISSIIGLTLAIL